MQVVILAGGLGTRLSEETTRLPKPMVDIGGRPILWHILKIYSHFGFNDFVILLGYKGYIIKEYFANYFLHQSDVTFDLATNQMRVHNNASEPWRVTLLDTGKNTMTGGRILRAREHVTSSTFLLTYGDGLSDVALDECTRFHEEHGGVMTITTVQPDGRYGQVDADRGGRISSFCEKPKGDGSWINGGFMVCGQGVFDYLKGGDSCILEREPLETLAREGKLYARRHRGFWKCMDTLRDKTYLDQRWNEGKAPWKIWS